jgi:enoyl-CoA hydratase/carnithine racemase
MATATNHTAANETSQGAEVLYEVADHIATLTLNRPERMNTISRAMLDQLTARLVEADRDPDVRVVILTGTGRAFCAGLDLTEATKGGGIAGAQRSPPISICATPRPRSSSTWASRRSAP